MLLLFIQDPEGIKHEIFVGRNSTVFDLKVNISKKLHITIQEQRLTYRGSELNNYLLLSATVEPSDNYIIMERLPIFVFNRKVFWNSDNLRNFIQGHWDNMLSKFYPDYPSNRSTSSQNGVEATGSGTSRASENTDQEWTDPRPGTSGASGMSSPEPSTEANTVTPQQVHETITLLDSPSSTTSTDEITVIVQATSSTPVTTGTRKARPRSRKSEKKRKHSTSRSTVLRIRLPPLKKGRVDVSEEKRPKRRHKRATRKERRSSPRSSGTSVQGSPQSQCEEESVVEDESAPDSPGSTQTEEPTIRRSQRLQAKKY